MKYIVDTNIFNDILDGHLSRLNFPKDCIFIATNVQLQELKNTKNELRRSKLLNIFHEVIQEVVLNESFALDIPGAGFDQSNWGDGKSVLLLKNELDAIKRKLNNWHDSIIAEVAWINGYGLITNDWNLAKISKTYGIKVICLKHLVKTLNQHAPT